MNTMRFIVIVYSFFTTMFASGQILEQLRCHDRVVSQGIARLALPRDAEQLFGTNNVDHFISNFGSKKREAVWNTVGYFGGRYEILISFPIQIDVPNCKLIGRTNDNLLLIQVNEVTKVELSVSGIAGAIMEGQWRLTESQWKTLVGNKGNWSELGIPISTNSPVPGFDEYVRQAREPIKNRKQGFDDAVRRLAP